MLMPASRSRARHRVYLFGDFQLDLDRESLSRGGQALKLRPKSFAVLRYLVEHAGCLAAKEELLSEIWGHLHVSEGSLTQCLIDIRRALEDADHQMVRTVPRRGYIFEMEVSATEVANAKASWRLMPRRFPIAAMLVMAVLVLGGAWGVRYVVRSGMQPTAKVPDSIAYNHYRRGEFFWNRRAAGDEALAEREFRLATKADPGFAPAWAGLAGALWAHIANTEKAPAPAELEAYREALEQAVAADPNLAEAHARLANYYFTVGNRQAFDTHWHKARALEPENLLVLGRGASLAVLQGHYKQAVSLQRRAAEVAPLSGVVHSNLAGFLMAAGRFREAEAEFRQVLELSPGLKSDDPDSASPTSGLALAIVLQRRFTEALAIIHEQPSNGPASKQIEALAFWGMGRRTEYMKAVARLERESGPRAPLYLAELDVFRGRREEAFSRLLAARDGLSDSIASPAIWYLLQELRLSPLLIPLRDDPRWKQLTKLPATES